MDVTPVINSVFTSVTYVLSNPAWGEVWLVDCGDVEKLDPSIPVAGVLLTHTHFDHIYGLNKLLEQWPEAKVYTNEYGAEALLNPRLNMSHYSGVIADFKLEKPENVVTIDEGTPLEVLGNPVTVKATPGHEPSCLVYLVDGKLFSGDAYIPGQKVVVNLPHCDRDLAVKNYALVEEMSRSYELYPGHPTTSHGEKPTV